MSYIKGFYELFISFPNIISVSNDAKLTVLTLMSLFLFFSFDRDLTYNFLLAYFTKENKLPLILHKIRITCSYIFNLSSWINLILWIILFTFYFLNKTPLDKTQKEILSQDILLIQNAICYILNIVLYTVFIDNSIYTFWANFHFKSMKFKDRIVMKYKYYYAHMKVSVLNLILSIITFSFLIVTIDMNFFSPFLGGNKFSTSYFAVLLLTVFIFFVGSKTAIHLSKIFRSKKLFKFKIKS